MQEWHRVLKPEGRIVILTPNKYYYSSVIAKLTPNWFHRYFKQKIAQDEAYDTFPIYYRLNSKKCFYSIARATGLRLQNIQTVRNYPYYLIFSTFLFRLGIHFEKITSSLGFDFAHSSLLVTMYKPKV